MRAKSARKEVPLGGEVALATERRLRAFRELVEPHRAAVTLHCYRMLASLEDAEDVAQETLTRAWERIGDLQSEDASRGWLYRIATNACLDALRGRRRRTLPSTIAPPSDPASPLGPPQSEGLWIEPIPEALVEAADEAERGPEAWVSRRESVALAFIVALQYLPPRQRAALLLVEVLDFSAKDVAEHLGTTVASVNSLLQRARDAAAIAQRTRAVDPARELADDELLRRYIAAWERADMSAFAALLTEDAVLSMPPQREWYAGRAAICRFVGGVWAAMLDSFRLVPIRANGMPAVALYRRSDSDTPYEGFAIALLRIEGGYLTEIVGFKSQALFARFALPATR